MRADLASFDPDGVTLRWRIRPSEPWLLHFLALGGTTMRARVGCVFIALGRIQGSQAGRDENRSSVPGAGSGRNRCVGKGSRNRDRSCERTTSGRCWLWISTRRFAWTCDRCAAKRLRDDLAEFSWKHADDPDPAPAQSARPCGRAVRLLPAYAATLLSRPRGAARESWHRNLDRNTR